MRLMPIFLSEQFNDILYADKIEKAQLDIANIGKMVAKPSSNKAEVGDFMKRTIDAQKLKKAEDRKARKGQPKDKEEVKTKANHSDIDHIQTTAKGNKSKCENEQIYMEQIRTLRNEQQLKDSDFELLREKIIKLQKQNTWLQNTLLKEKENKLTVDAKISKIVNVKEIETNSDLLELGGKNFFDAQKKKRKDDIQTGAKGSENNMKLQNMLLRKVKLEPTTKE